MYERDGFISYTHIDNLELDEGQKGWVAKLHSALEVKVTQRLGRRTQFWRDPKLDGNDDLDDTIIQLLGSVATLAPILSPGYIRSKWCLRELAEFCSAAREQGGLRIQNKGRIFKVLKTPVPLEEQPAELQSLLGYEFFRSDPETGRVRELDEIYGPDAKREFWLRLDDLAEDLCNLLKLIEDPGGDIRVPASTVFLAETTSDLREQRDSVKRELRQRGCLVLPDRPLPLFAPDVAAAVREDLSRCEMSIHMIGRHYSLVPEGGVESLLEVQNNLAIERSKNGSLSRLLWIPRGLKILDERQAAVIDTLRMDERAHAGADLLETSLEDLKTAIDRRLSNRGNRLEREPEAASETPTWLQVYLLYNPQEADAIVPWADLLFKDFEVIHPVFSDDEAENRRAHDEYLRSCDGVVIFYGAAREPWLLRKLAELQKSAGYGRTKAMPEVAICLIAPRTAEKERFRTHHKALVIPQWDGMTPEALQPFVSAVKARGEGQRDRGGDLV